MPKFRMETITANCTGCLRCALACSDAYTKAFNPLAANLRVIVAGEDCEIAFLEGCKGCGLCADSCFYGALIKIPVEAAA